MARKIKLREYHMEVVARLQDIAQASGTPVSSRLGVQIGTGLWFADLASVSEVIPLPSCTAVPLTHPWLRGVANVRGNLYTVVDLAAFLGEPGGTQPGAEARVLLAHGKYGVNCGLQVRRILGLRSLDWFTPEPSGAKAAPWDAGQYRGSDGNLWRELNIEALVRQPEFLDVAIFQRRSIFTNPGQAPSD